MQANREEIISQADNNAQKKDDKKSTINLHVVLWLLLPKIKMMILLRPFSSLLVTSAGRPVMIRFPG